jgi:hypothetical protein
MFPGMDKVTKDQMTTVDWREELARLIEEYRDRCLWFLRPDFMPTTTEQILRTLDQLERYGDRAAYQRAEAIKRWLQAPSKA